ncbi:helix-turn-helix domain-containing protein [Micromonospora orduensis]|uniref:helix-turn-helix domain-containing protein n=1 Tax=Micromonospora orduensis TaxID=1420891 RepID=UPI0036260D56
MIIGSEKFDWSKFTTTLPCVPVGRSRRENSRFRGEAEALAIRLRALRSDKGMTQEQLAGRAQVAVSTLRKIESGRVVEPGYFTILALANAMGVDPHELADPKDRPE